MASEWNVINCENRDRFFVNQSQRDYDIIGNTWTNRQTPSVLTQATRSVTRSSSYSASNSITLGNAAFGNVWGGVYSSTGTERKLTSTSVSEFTHKDSAVSLSARGVFSASLESSAEDVLGFRTVKLKTSDIDSAMGGNIKATGKGAFRVDGLLTAEDGLSFDGLVNSDILAWFGNNSLSVSINSAGSTFEASGSSVNDALIGYEQVTLSYGSGTTELILGGKTSLSANVTLKEAVSAGGVKYNATASAGISLKSAGSATLNRWNADAVIGYTVLTVNGNADVGTAIGGNLSVKFSGKAAATGGSDTNWISYAEGSGSLAFSLKSTGRANISGSETEVDTLIGYQNVTVSSASAGTVFGGNLSVKANGAAGFSGFDGETIQELFDDSLPDTLAGLSELLRSADLNLSASLKSSGRAELTGAAQDDEYNAGTMIGYADFSALQNSSAGLVLGGNLSLSFDGDTLANSKVAEAKAALQSTGQARIHSAQVDALIGYQTLSLNTGSVVTSVGGKLSVDTVVETANTGSVSLAWKAGLNSQSSVSMINGSTAGMLAGYRNLSVNASTVGSIAIGGNISFSGSGVLAPVMNSEDSRLTASAKLTVKSVGAAAITNRSTVGDLIGYQKVTIDQNSTAGNLYGGSISGTLSTNGFQMNREELGGFLTSFLRGGSGQSDERPLDGIAGDTVFSGSWKSAGSVSVAGGSVEGIFGYSTVTLSYTTVGSAHGGNYAFTNAQLSPFNPGNANTCRITAAGKLTGTELDITDITGFKTIQITGGSVVGAVSATASASNDLAQRGTVFSVIDVDFSDVTTISGYSKITVDRAYNSAVGTVTTTNSNDTFTLRGNSVLAVESFLFGAGNDKLQITGNSTLSADSLNFGSGRDVLDVADGSRLNFYGDNIEGLEKITGRGTIAVTNEALAIALRQLTKTATILYVPPVGFAAPSLLLENDAVYNLDAGMLPDALTTASASALFDDGRKSGVLGSLIA